MAYEINFNLLSKSELDYEIAIRGGSKSDDPRKIITKLSAKYTAEDILSSTYPITEDVSSISKSLEKATRFLAMLEAKFVPEMHLRTESLLHHVFHRINRMDSGALDIKEFNAIWDKFNTAYARLNSLSGASQSECSVTKDSLSLTYDRKLFSELAKFKYNGKSCVRTFIERVEEFVMSRNVPYDKILSFAFEIFSGDALIWYRSIRDSVKSWNDLCDLMKRDFSPHNYDFRLMSEIRARSQGQTETITIYIAKMHSLFARLGSPVAESEKLEILLNNIRPCYTNCLLTANVVDVASLVEVCRRYEQFESRSKQFSEPPGRSSETLAPDLAYNSPSANYTFSKVGNFKKTFPYQKSQTNNFTKSHANPKINSINILTNKTKQFCPRCRNNSHSLSTCRQPHYLICFKCGKTGFKIADCPNCNKPKNNTAVSKN